MSALISKPVKQAHDWPTAIADAKGEGSVEMISQSAPMPLSFLRDAPGWFAALSMLFVSGCLLYGAPVREDLARVRLEMKSQSDPLTFINQMRSFALESIDNLSDAERQILAAHPPEITTNHDETQLSFAWKVSSGSYIEVLSTPAPCIPMTAFRTRQVKFM
jgi:hypothetical protein